MPHSTSSAKRRWRRGDRLAYGKCPLCDEIVAHRIEAIFPGLIVTKIHCTKYDLDIYGCTQEPDYRVEVVTGTTEGI